MVQVQNKTSLVDRIAWNVVFPVIALALIGLYSIYVSAVNDLVIWEHQLKRY